MSQKFHAVNLIIAHLVQPITEKTAATSSATPKRLEDHRYLTKGFSRWGRTSSQQLDTLRKLQKAYQIYLHPSVHRSKTVLSSAIRVFGDIKHVEGSWSTAFFTVCKVRLCSHHRIHSSPPVLYMIIWFQIWHFTSVKCTCLVSDHSQSESPRKHRAHAQDTMHKLFISTTEFYVLEGNNMCLVTLQQVLLE